MKCTFSNNQSLLIILFILYPFATLPFLFIKIIERKKYAFVLLAVFMGLCGILYPPLGDLYRHSLRYFSYFNENGNNWYVDDNLKDYFLPIITMVFANLKIPFEFVRFLFITISYLLIFKLFLFTYKKNKIHNGYPKLFIVSFLSVPFIYIVTGLRYGFSLCIFVYGIFMLCNKNRLGWGIILLSVSIHIFMLLPFLITLVARIYPYRINKITMSILSILGLFVSNTVIIYFVNMLIGETAINKAIIDYTVGNAYFVDSRSLFGIIAKILECITVLPLTYCLYRYKIENCFLNNLFCIFIMGFCVMSSFFVFTMRILLLFVLLFFFIYLYNAEKRKKYVLQNVLLLSSLISASVYLYGYREELTKSQFPMIFISPTPIILSISYSEQWINNLPLDDSNNPFLDR